LAVIRELESGQGEHQKHSMVVKYVPNEASLVL